jgi:hypothetical protein
VKVVTAVATLAWLGLGAYAVDGIVRSMLWLVLTPIAVCAVVFGLDGVLSRLRLRRRG